MDFNRQWTPSALAAEVAQHGTARIAKAHNKLRADLVGLQEELARCQHTDELTTSDLMLLLINAPDSFDQDALNQACFDRLRKVAPDFGGGGRRAKQLLDMAAEMMDYE